MKLILFDCDGTLVDTAANIHECMCRTFDEAGHPVPQLEQTKDVIGLSLDLAIAQILQRPVDAEMSNLALRYKEHFVAMRSEPDFSEPLYDGIAALLDDLAAREDVLLGIVTGKSRRGVSHVLQTHGFEDLFFAIRTADDCPSKPHPAMVLECCLQCGMEPDNSIVIGDSIYDMQMADAARAKAIGVSWGYHSSDRLLKYGAEEIALQPADIANLIET